MGEFRLHRDQRVEDASLIRRKLREDMFGADFDDRYIIVLTNSYTLESRRDLSAVAKWYRSAMFYGVQA